MVFTFNSIIQGHVPFYQPNTYSTYQMESRLEVLKYSLIYGN